MLNHHHWHFGNAQILARLPARYPSDDGEVLVDDDGLDDAKTLDRGRQRSQLCGAMHSRVVGTGAQAIDRDLHDLTSIDLRYNRQFSWREGADARPCVALLSTFLGRPIPEHHDIRSHLSCRHSAPRHTVTTAG